MVDPQRTDPSRPCYKVLDENGSAMHGGSGAWHLPKGKRPGKWMPPMTNEVPQSGDEQTPRPVCAFCDEEAEAVLADGSHVVCWHHFQLICDGERDRATVERILAHV